MRRKAKKPKAKPALDGRSRVRALARAQTLSAHEQAALLLVLKAPGALEAFVAGLRVRASRRRTESVNLTDFTRGFETGERWALTMLGDEFDVAMRHAKASRVR